MCIYLYFQQTSANKEPSDYRFFVRSIIRHSDLVNRDASFEFLQSEGERTLLEALDSLEYAMSHNMAQKTDCNHIFLNFQSTLTIQDCSEVMIICE